MVTGQLEYILEYVHINRSKISGVIVDIELILASNPKNRTALPIIEMEPE